MSKPDLIILGQITIDHVVPAMPGPWSVQVGGNALYAAAGARLWMDPAAIGLVFRRGRDFPIDVEAVLARAGISHVLRRDVDIPHLVEWIIYEADGSRRCLPKNDGLRHIGSEGAGGDIEAYFDYLLQFSPEATDLPGDWLPARAIHLAPQVRDRQIASLRQLAGQADFISVDPSAFVSKRHDAAGLGKAFASATALLPSELEIAHLAQDGWPDAARALAEAGFAEVIFKRGTAPVILGSAGNISEIAVPAVNVVDPTGAGDSFCGGYVACRLMGFSPEQAVRCAIVTAGLVVGTEGAEAALALDPRQARERLRTLE